MHAGVSPCRRAVVRGGEEGNGERKENGLLNFCDEAIQTDKWPKEFLFCTWAKDHFFFLADILVKEPLKGPGFCDDVKDSKSKWLKSLASEDIVDRLLGWSEVFSRTHTISKEDHQY